MKSTRLKSGISTFFNLFVAVVFCATVVLSAAGAAKKYYIIDAAKCKLCKSCVEVCPEDVIHPVKVNGKMVNVIDAAKCTDCAACANICPNDAITRSATSFSSGTGTGKDKAASNTKVATGKKK
ncbi:MAG: 4Fe-4S dicluster domain-containing protein [Chitinivibrionales bacterium]|nr:4Fe-4S dicluster domain-containing protein [Chitinivibrionales bacterium]